MTQNREQAIDSFLHASGWNDADIRPLAGDASNRRYLRLTRKGERAVLMDAPPARGEDVRPFIAMTEWLTEAGLSAPNLLSADAETGLLLLEDLGDDLYARHVQASPGDEGKLYRAAVRLLVHLANLPVPEFLAPYDRVPLDREAALFTQWWLPGATGIEVPVDACAEYAELVAAATKMVEPARDVVVLRDYHAENLVWLPERNAHAKVGLLDYQDALSGHVAYDLMSLLEDARRDTTDDLQKEMVALYLAERPDLDADAFRAAYAALGAQRNLKIIGIFARLGLRDGKPRYLDLIPRVWGHLQRDLSHPSLAALRDWVDRHSPKPEPAVLARLAAAVPA
jgi:aminoglycoside/choline kinase family phosphotransferase